MLRSVLTPVNAPDPDESHFGPIGDPLLSPTTLLTSEPARACSQRRWWRCTQGGVIGSCQGGSTMPDVHGARPETPSQARDTEPGQGHRAGPGTPSRTRDTEPRSRYRDTEPRSRYRDTEPGSRDTEPGSRDTETEPGSRDTETEPGLIDSRHRRRHVDSRPRADWCGI